MLRSSGKDFFVYTDYLCLQHACQDECKWGLPDGLQQCFEVTLARCMQWGGICLSSAPLRSMQLAPNLISEGVTFLSPPFRCCQLPPVQCSAILLAVCHLCSAPMGPVHVGLLDRRRRFHDLQEQICILICATNDRSIVDQTGNCC